MICLNVNLNDNNYSNWNYNMLSILILALVILSVLAYIIIRHIYRKNDNYVRNQSPMYKKILDLNSKYKFNYLNPIVNIEVPLKSKRGFDSFIISDYLEKYFMENYFDYTDKIDQLKRNKLSYSDYSKEYIKCASLIMKKEDFTNHPIGYSTFHRHEKAIYKKSRQDNPPISMKMHIHVYYRSPAGNKYYSTSYDLSYEEIIYACDKEKIRRSHEEAVREAKLRKAEEDRAKKREYNANLKRMKNLDAMEAELKRKQEEFDKATKGHIYTSEVKTMPEKEKRDISSMDINAQLKILKEEYENGEISYEEYVAKRDELL